MSSADIALILISCAGIALAIWMIARLGFHPFIGLLTAALAIGIVAGAPPADVLASAEKGFGDILKGAGLVVALGLGLGAVLQLSGGAHALAHAALSITGKARAAWGAMAAAFVLGLPLFFETGVVLLLPIIATAFAANALEGPMRLRVMLSAVAALSVLHALLPPHPGPLIAVGELGAPLGRTMILGLIVAVPVALIAGPILARFTTRGVAVSETGIAGAPAIGNASAGAALAVLLFPVVLITAGAFLKIETGAPRDAFSQWLALIADPVVALLLALLIGIVVLFGRRATAADVQATIWKDALQPAAGILLAIGAGGALKQVLVDAGLSRIFVRLAEGEFLPPLVLAWLVAVAVRVATGSATVATITTAGVMAGVASQSGVDPALMVLAIGCGSVFFSHVNDPGFWLVKAYLGTSTIDTFRTWSVLETVISVVGLLIILAMQAALSLL